MSHQSLQPIRRLLWVIGTLIASPALAQDSVTSFYRDTQVKLLVGGAAGGGYDAYARLIARHIGRYIPGNPSIVVQHMPGAGGSKVAEFLYTTAPKDGSVFVATQPGALMEPLLGEQGKARYDSTKFTYLGSANSETSLCIMRSEAPIKKFDDAFTQTAILGATAAGGSTNAFPKALNAVLGTKFKVIAGYKGTSEISLALERGEVDGFCGQFWSSVSTQRPGWVTSNSYRFIAQEALKGNPDLDKKGVPLAYSYAKSEDDKKVLRLIYGPLVFGRVFLMPPDVPSERIEAFRTAFAQTLKDERLLDEAAKSGLSIEHVSGEEVQALVADLYSMPEPIVRRAQEAAR